MVERADNQMKMARRVVSERLQLFFSELREVLDPDTDDFFERVLQQTKSQHAGGVHHGSMRNHP
jgi:hypothetical protein